MADSDRPKLGPARVVIELETRGEAIELPRCCNTELAAAATRRWRVSHAEAFTCVMELFGRSVDIDKMQTTS